MAFDLTGKVAIVTGGTKGIGLGITRLLAHSGADIVVAARTAPDCEKTAQEVRSMGRRALGCPTDIAKLDDIRNLFQGAVEEFGHVDIVVNNSGVGVTKPATMITEEDWQLMADVNMKGTYFMCMEAAKQMLTQESRGNIVNIASNSASFATPMLVNYAATKAYIAHLTKGLAAEWAKEGIRVNGVSPGTVPTEMTKPLLSNPGMEKNIKASIPLGKLATPEDIAAAVLYLASDEAGMVTGEVIVVDGGRNIV